MTGLFAADSAAVAELRTDDISKADSLYRLKMAGIKIESDTTKHKRGWLMSDSMSRRCAGFRPYCPVTDRFTTNNTGNCPFSTAPWARVWPSISTKTRLTSPSSANTKPTRTKPRARPNWTRCKARMIRSNTRRQVYLGLGGLVHLFHRRRRRELLDQRGLGRQESHHAGLHLPGAGQIYNKSYWKVPFVVGGFAAMIYCIDWNNRGYQRFKRHTGC